jgi:3-hydroxyisobutyrate dehydrogenase-like beta-hydroxyacid dehydrogenase
MDNLGFAVFGIIGKPMAGHLTAAGHTDYVYNRTLKVVQELSAKGFVPS